MSETKKRHREKGICGYQGLDFWDDSDAEDVHDARRGKFDK